MADTTYEEACRCPKCGSPGNVKMKAKAKGGNLKPGTQVHTVYCENQLCRWYNTCWLVQVNADGSVPPPRDHRNEPKTYAGFEYHDEQAKAIIAALKAQQEAEIDPERREIRNPRG